MTFSFLFYFLIISWILLKYGKSIIKQLNLSMLMTHIIGFWLIVGLLVFTDTNIFLSFFGAIPIYLWYVISSHANHRYWVISLSCLTVVYILDLISSMIWSVFSVFFLLLKFILGIVGAGVNLVGGGLTIWENKRIYWQWWNYVAFIFRIGFIMSMDDMFSGIMGTYNEELGRFNQISRLLGF